jgi:excisionase family DNA binding protein
MSTASSRQPEMLTIKDVAAKHKVSFKTIRHRIKRGEQRAHQFGRLLRISEDDLALYELQARR